MKKTSFSIKTLGMALLCVIVGIVPTLTSCQKEKSANVTDLLSTVPSSAGVVVGFNLSSLLDKAGCKVDGSAITPGKEIKEILDSPTYANDKQSQLVKMLLSGDSGIDPVGAIFFTDAYNSYLTAALADTEKFCAFVEQQTEIPFKNEDGNVKVSGNVAVSGAQMWMSPTANVIDPKAVKNYASLDNAQSFASLDVAADIKTMTHDVVGYGQLKNFSRSGLSFGDVASINFLTGFLFDNATALSFNLDFLKGETKATAMLLNSKGQPAKYLLPSPKISVDEVKRLPASADVVIAAALSKDLVKKISKMAESLGGGFPSQVTGALSALDGTTAFALGSLDNPENALVGVIATDGNAPLDFMQILSQLGSTQKDGKIVKVVRGEVSGALDIPKMADKFKGASMGAVFTTNSDLLKGKQAGLNTAAVMLTPESNSLALNIWVETSEPGNNSLLTILKSLAN